MIRTVDTSAFALSKAGWGIGRVRGVQFMLNCAGLSLWDYPSWDYLHRHDKSCILPTEEEMNSIRANVKVITAEPAPTLVDKTEDVSASQPKKPKSKAAGRLAAKTDLCACIGAPHGTDLSGYINKLPTAERKLVTMKFLKHMTNSQIASVLDRTPSSVGAQISTGVRHVREMYEGVRK